MQLQAFKSSKVPLNAGVIAGHVQKAIKKHASLRVLWGAGSSKTEKTHPQTKEKAKWATSPTGHPVKSWKETQAAKEQKNCATPVEKKNNPYKKLKKQKHP